MRGWLAGLALVSMMAPALAAPLESILRTPGPEGALEGTLLSPSAQAPVVLIIPGSGPTDRDGNNALGPRPATYRLLAEALAERGIATLRIDKRGMFGSRAAVANANAVTMQDYAGDVTGWVSLLRQRGAACVWLLGHSEGGLVALLAAKDGEGICGNLLVATPGLPIGSLLRRQLAANPANAPVLAEAGAAIAKLEAGERVDTATLHPALRPLFHPAVQGFLISQMALEPAALIAATRQPTLILQGLSDLQVERSDAERLQSVRPDATLTLLPGVTHVLKAPASEDYAANIATYTDPSLPLAPGVVDALVAFVQRHGPQP